jgi:hypothetical protein
MIFSNRKPKKVDKIPKELVNGLYIEPKDVFVN